MKLVPERGDVQGEVGHPLKVCAAGFPHRLLEYQAGGTINTRTGKVKLLYRCVVCGTFVSFTTKEEPTNG